MDEVLFDIIASINALNDGELISGYYSKLKWISVPFVYIAYVLN